jgi:2-oxoisovalerate dehydrogenase E1 component alpha subunit
MTRVDESRSTGWTVEDFTSPPFQILAPDGSRSGAPYPDAITRDQHQQMLTTMIVTRRLDTEFVNLQRQGQLALFPSCLGQEAAQIGVSFALRPTDWLFPQYRELGVFVSRGIDPEGIGLMWRGVYHGGRGMLEKCCAPLCIPIGSQALHAAGYALGIGLDGGDSVAVGFLGDGSLSEGDVHEALNMAAVFDAPCVFVVQNNQWAISVPLSAQTRSATLAQKAVAYGMPGVRCDGNDVLASWTVMTEAVERARRGEGPTLVELVTYRMGAHTTSDDPTRYRDEMELKHWAELDPIDRYRRHLSAEGLWAADDEERAAEAASSAATHLRDSVFDAPDPDPLTVFDHVLSSPTAELNRQRDQLAAELELEAS